MILEVIFNGFKILLFTCFSWINLPSLPVSLSDSLDTFLDIVFRNASVVGFFIRPLTIQILVPLVIAVINFDKIYKFTMFILKKIPVLNIK